MAMNFKVFEDKQHAADYAGDIIRNNLTITTTIAGFHLNKDSAPVLDELKIS